MEPDDVALVEGGQHVGTDVVQQRDPGLVDDLRPEVGVAAGDAAARVHDGSRPAGDERLTRDRVDVRVVDDRDVARLQALGEVLRPPVDARRAGDARSALRGGSAPYPG